MDSEVRTQLDRILKSLVADADRGDCLGTSDFLEFVDRGEKSPNYADWSFHISICPSCRHVLGEIRSIEALQAEIKSLERPRWRTWASGLLAQRSVKLGLAASAVFASIVAFLALQGRRERDPSTFVKKEPEQVQPGPGVIPKQDLPNKTIDKPKPDVVVKSKPLGWQKSGLVVSNAGRRPKISQSAVRETALDRRFTELAEEMAASQVTRGGTSTDPERYPQEGVNTNWLTQPAEGDGQWDREGIVLKFAPDQATSRTVELTDLQTRKTVDSAFVPQDGGEAASFALQEGLRLREGREYRLTVQTGYPADATSPTISTEWRFRVFDSKDRRVWSWARKNEAAHPELAAVALYSISMFGSAERIAADLDQRLISKEPKLQPKSAISLAKWKVIRSVIRQAYEDRCDDPAKVYRPKAPQRKAAR